ncbi:MAG: 50S ribosomal protein L31e [Nitrososphaerota archaeon]|nr:50S ribosomal protein L31e [Candidatus Bathyarchaeota archaeon]MDW8022493.1 50S ribosomal protein L31e [Nitrososphaerota archaeon]
MEETKSIEETDETSAKVEKTEEAEKEPLEEVAEKQAVEEVKEAKPKLKEEAKEEIVEERFYTVPLGKAWLMPPNKRAPKAVRILRDFVKKHMKLEAKIGAEEEETEPKRLIISNEVNEKIWSRGIEKPPRKIRIKAAKDKEGNVTVYLAEGD